MTIYRVISTTAITTPPVRAERIARTAPRAAMWLSVTTTARVPYRLPIVPPVIKQVSANLARATATAVLTP